MAYLYADDVTTIFELLDKISDFAVSNGWELTSDQQPYPMLQLGQINSGAAVNPRLPSGNLFSLLTTARCGVLNRRSGNIAPEELPQSKRVILKDPQGAYFHVFAIQRTGTAENIANLELGFLEVWLSDKLADNTGNPPLIGHPGLFKMGVAGPFRDFSNCHLFTGQNASNNRMYFNLAVETVPESYEHFSFGSIETYFDMPCGEFYQGSGHDIGNYSNNDYTTKYHGTNQNAYSTANSIWGNLLLNYTRDQQMINCETNWNINSAWNNTPDRGVCMLLRHQLFGRTKGIATNIGMGYSNGFQEPAAVNIYSPAQPNEFLIQPMLFAGTPVINVSPNEFTGVSMLAPVYAGIYSPLENNMWALVGHFPNQRICHIVNNLPQDVVTFGDDEWMLFPLNRKSAATFDQTFPVGSGNFGVAYRK